MNVTTGDPIDADKTDLEAVDALHAAYGQLRKELGKAIVGQGDVLEQLLMCIFARGHAILELSLIHI